MIRCNNCEREFIDESELELFLETRNGQILLYDEAEAQDRAFGAFRGCPYCQTDGYLMDLE